jgi:antitoxin ParD1/3/4
MMSTRNVHLTNELDQFVDDSIKSGRYENASEVIRAGLRALAQSEAEDQAKVEALRTAIQEGFDSGIAKGDVIARLRGVIRERAKANRRRSA